MNTQDDSANQHDRRERSLLSRFMSTIFWAFFLGFLILVIMNAVHWKKQGYTNMLQSLNNQYVSEVSYLEHRNPIVSRYCVGFFNLVDHKIISIIANAKTTITKSRYKENIGIEHTTSQHSLFTSAFFDSLSGIKKISFMLWKSFLVLSFKFINVFGAFSLFIFALLFGALNGLVTRYVRTVEGGRESTFMFHKMTEIIIQIPMWVIILYFISPIMMSPVLVIGLLTGSFFLAMYIATASLKKFI